MTRKIIWTHVSSKALAGMQRLFADRDIYIWPAPYKKSDGRDGWTVVTIRK